MSRRTNAEWLSDLRAGGQRREAALAELRAEILSGLPYALRDWLPPQDPQFAPLAEETAQEALVRALDNLDSFAGRSQFTTWVHKIAVRLALTELRRRHWKDISLEHATKTAPRRAAAGLLADRGLPPEAAVERSLAVEQVQRMMAEELTDKQLRAMRTMLAMGQLGVPLAEVARQLGTERNALYKLLHDARLRLKRRLARDGLTPAELLSVFERG